MEDRDSRNREKISLYTKSLCLYFILLPAGMLNIGALGSLLKIVGLLPLAVFLMERNFKIRILPSFKVQFIFTLWAALSMLWSINASQSWERVYSLILFILLLLPIGSNRFSRHEIDMMKSSLVWASRLSVVLTLALGITGEGRLYLSGLFTEDPNLLSAYYIFGISNAFVVLMDKQSNSIKKALSGFELLLYTYTILLTGSRGGLLSVLSAVAILFLFYNENEDRSIIIKKATIVGVALAVSGVVISMIPEQLLVRYTLQNVIESRGTHRLDIWGRGLTIFTNSSFFRQLFGYGYYTVRSVFVAHGYPSKVMHNVFIEYLLEIGIVGLLIYIYSLWVYAKQAARTRDIFSVAIIISMVVLSISTNIIAFKPYWNILIFSMCNVLHHEEVNEMTFGEDYT